jgi:hypothetical protein
VENGSIVSIFDRDSPLADKEKAGNKAGRQKEQIENGLGRVTEKSAFVLAILLEI